MLSKLGSLLALFGALAVAGCREKPANPESKALEILRLNQEAMFGLRTYQADCETILKFPEKGDRSGYEKRESARLICEKPNKMRYDSWWSEPGEIGREEPDRARVADLTFACDGKVRFQQYGRSYHRENSTDPEHLWTSLEPWEGFFSPKVSIYSSMVKIRKNGEVYEVAYEGTELVDGIECDKVRVHKLVDFMGRSQEYSGHYYFGKDDHLVRRHSDVVKFGGELGFSRDAVIRNLKVNQAIKDPPYVYTPPKGVKFLPQTRDESETRPLLANGVTAPDFTAKDVNGRAFRLSEYKGRTVLLDFWASWCGPCVMSMPHTQTAVEDLQRENLDIVALAIDNGEAWQAFEKWVKTNKAKYPKLRFGHLDPKLDVAGGKYGVSGIPTQFVIGKDGRIAASFVGFSEDSRDLKTALRTAASN